MYASTSGALVAQAQVDTIANNLANVNTAGFKRTLLQVQSQPERDLYRYQTDPGRRPSARVDGVAAQQYVGALGSGAQVYDTPASFEQGAIASTGNDLDVALSGPGFFAIRGGNGALRYTRDGAFVRDANGLLTAKNGDRVLGRNGAPIALPAQGAIGIGRDGAIAVDGRAYAQLNVVEFANPAALRPEGGNRFIDAGAGARAARITTSVQGSLEKSNADVVRSMVDLIAAERWFQSNQKSIQTQDDAVAQAITTVGRTNA
ncbi:MAG: flagellar basal-body rod protein FlgF [Candidatus Elarobacter sp.]